MSSTATAAQGVGSLEVQRTQSSIRFVGQPSRPQSGIFDVEGAMGGIVVDRGLWRNHSNVSLRIEEDVNDGWNLRMCHGARGLGPAGDAALEMVILSGNYLGEMIIDSQMDGGQKRTIRIGGDWIKPLTVELVGSCSKELEVALEGEDPDNWVIKLGDEPQNGQQLKEHQHGMFWSWTEQNDRIVVRVGNLPAPHEPRQLSRLKP